MYFVDSSALIKAYVSETGTPVVKAALDSLGGDVCISTVVVVETASALARLRRTMQMRQKVYARVRDKLLNDCKTQFYVVHPPKAVVGTTVGMIDQHRMRSPGGSDLLHLATAEHVQRLFPGQTIAFMCCDLALRSVAEERGFDVFDPLRVPLSALLPPTPPGQN